MNNEMKQRWVEALRSGDYKQTTGFLHSNSGYCCLGVLCDLDNPDGWEKSDYSSNSFSFENSGNFYISTLPAALKRKYNITPVTIDDLINMNDRDRDDFNRIASYIEKEL